MTENRNDLITITAGELMDRQFLPRHTVVENFLPAGTFILSGQPKIGKSFLMLKNCVAKQRISAGAVRCS